MKPVRIIRTVRRRWIQHSGIKCLDEPGFCKVVTIAHFCHQSGLLAM